MLDLLNRLGQPRGLPKGTFKGVQRDMLARFAELAESIYEQKRSAILVFEGWDAAGKGTTIRSLTERLDARGYKVLATQAARTHEKQKPWLWRFWMNIPRYGQIAIYDRSWYGRVLVERVQGLTPAPEWIAAYEEINQFEHTLADDGAIFVKFWLHISRQEQLRRFIELAQTPATAWQVTAEDWENHRRYDEYSAAVRDMLANTSTPYAPWAAVDATNREYRLYSVCRALIERLEEALGAEHSRWPAPEELDAFDAGTEREAAQPKPAKKEKRKAKTAASTATLDGATLDGATLDGAALDGAALDGAALPRSNGATLASAPANGAPDAPSASAEEDVKGKRKKGKRKEEKEKGEKKDKKKQDKQRGQEAAGENAANGDPPADTEDDHA